jgi:hypothetical protein
LAFIPSKKVLLLTAVMVALVVSVFLLFVVVPAGPWVVLLTGTFNLKQLVIRFVEGL